jgi:hypothetical protein
MWTPWRCSASSAPGRVCSIRTAAHRWTPAGFTTSSSGSGSSPSCFPEVVELDLNPVIIGPDGCVVVDARIRVPAAAGGDPALRALGI